MCGGRILIQPCSQVGHVYRHRPQAHHANINGRTHISLWRLADRLLTGVHMDLFKALYPRELRPQPSDAAITSSMNTLKCASFQWYLDSVYPEAPFPRGLLLIGKVLCLTPMSTRVLSSATFMCLRLLIVIDQ